MLSAHAATLARARTYVAALADSASSERASQCYEHALLHLDAIHGDDVPALEPMAGVEGRDDLRVLADSAIEQLVDYGVDPLQVELALVTLHDARAFDTLV